MTRVLALVTTSAVAFVVGSLWLAFYPPVLDDLGGVQNLDPVARRVRIPTAHGDSLDAWVLPGDGRGVIGIFHGYGRKHDRAWRYAQFLQRNGYTIVTVDFRSSRPWRRVPSTVGVHEIEDARALLDWVRAEPRLAGQPVGLLGESLGGAVAVALAAERPEVRALVADCPFATAERALEDSFRRWAGLPPDVFVPPARLVGRLVTGIDPGSFDPLAVTPRLRDRPVFIIHSGRDDRLDPSQGVDLWVAAGAKDPRWLIPESGHNDGWRDHRELYESRVLSFFAHGLRGTGDGLPAGAL